MHRENFTSRPLAVYCQWPMASANRPLAVYHHSDGRRPPPRQADARRADSPPADVPSADARRRPTPADAHRRRRAPRQSAPAIATRTPQRRMVVSCCNGKFATRKCLRRCAPRGDCAATEIDLNGGQCQKTVSERNAVLARCASAPRLSERSARPSVRRCRQRCYDTTRL